MAGNDEKPSLAAQIIIWGVAALVLLVVLNACVTFLGLTGAR